MVRQIVTKGSPRGLRRILFRLPVALYRLKLGRLLGGRLILLTHTGRKSGRRRQVVLEVVGRPGDGTLLVASGFGPRAQWFRNVLVDPAVLVTSGSSTRPGLAAPLPPQESGLAMATYARRHPRLARRLMRFCGYEVDGSEADYFEVGRDHIPIVSLRPLH
ncbi:nitroreductase family deazaflavin-dependent oxidoreductase [Micromonospora chersina]|uniref:nitroreductase family deazaflavin-dependent oxidoreductase n=1 Tax=Micromonospora chersina TaxID=47854 RepID=UPI0033DC2E10